MLLSGYKMEVPLVKYFFTVFENIDGWGIETVFMAVGLGVVFYLVRDRQKNPWISGLSAGFYTYILLGMFIYLLANKKRRETLFLVPLMCVVLICIASPVNAYMRYMMPVMAAMPMSLAGCYIMRNAKEIKTLQ